MPVTVILVLSLTNDENGLYKQLYGIQLIQEHQVIGHLFLKEHQALGQKLQQEQQEIGPV